MTSQKCHFYKTNLVVCSISRFGVIKRQKCRIKAVSRSLKSQQISIPDDVKKTLQNNPPPKHFISLPNDYGYSLSWDWWAGFMQYRGTLGISIEKNRKSQSSVSYMGPTCHFSIQLRNDSVHILIALHELLGQQGIFIPVQNSTWKYAINSKKLRIHLLPILDLIPLQGKKYLQYAFFRAIAQVVHNNKNKHKNDITEYTLYNCLNWYCIVRNMLKKSSLRQKKILVQQQKKFQSDLQNWLKNNQQSLSQSEINRWKYQLIQINKKKKISEDFVVGFVDAVGGYSIQFYPSWSTYPSGCGNIYVGKNQTAYKVQSFKDIFDIIIPFFLRNPLLSGKYYDFERFACVAYQLRFTEGVNNDFVKKLLQIYFKDRQELGNNQKYTEDQFLEILDIAKTREEFQKIKPQLKQIRKQLEEKWKTL